MKLASFETFCCWRKNVYCRSSSKHCALDPRPTWLIKLCGDVMLPFITDIFNTSVPTGHSSTVWKTAVIKPLINKSRLDQSSPANYRPVSNLPFLFKIFERVAHKQVTPNLSEANLFSPFQSAYTSRHSTETAVLKVFCPMLSAQFTRIISPYSTSQ